MKRTFILFSILLATLAMNAQNDSQPETDPIILNRIEQWQDLKFGFMAHWGMYSQWGVVESWSICNEPWINRNGADYYEYKKEYQALNKTFEPKHFESSQGGRDEIHGFHYKAPRWFLYVRQQADRLQRCWNRLSISHSSTTRHYKGYR